MSKPDVELPVPKLSQELQYLLQVANGRDLTIGEIEAELQGRGIGVVIMLLAIPFALPVPNPTSTVFGVGIMLFGVRLLFNTGSFLPAAILHRKVAHSLLARIVKASAKICRLIEKFSKPRLAFMHNWPAMRAMIGFGILCGGFVLALPVLVPNGLPAISVVFLTAGLMEEDGLFVLLGYVTGVLSWIYLAVILILGREGVEALLRHFF